MGLWPSNPVLVVAHDAWLRGVHSWCLQQRPRFLGDRMFPEAGRVAATLSPVLLALVLRGPVFAVSKQQSRAGFSVCSGCGSSL